MSVPQPLIDDHNHSVSLAKLLGRGGEGAVYDVHGAPTLAAKIYAADKAPVRREKILAMIQAQLHKSTSNVAYPISPLFHAGGRFAGFIMEKAGHRKPVHELYSPSSRKTQFAKADFRFLVRTALNVSNAVASVHASGCVIGDINHSGILISQDALACLIDADSFQFRAGGKLHRCTVGVLDFTPPELQGQPLDQIERTVNHDSFGLGVVLFNLLFMGRHPFVGGYLGPADMPMEKAIAECRFAYSSDRARTRMEPPPHVPALEDVPEDLANAFETAFAPASTKGGRPSAADWARILKAAEADIIPCGSSPVHHYFKNAKSCPWCRMERGFPGFSAFTAAFHINTRTPVDLSQLIGAIRAVPDPGIAAPLSALMPSVQITRSLPSPADASGTGTFIFTMSGALICLALLMTQAIAPFLAISGFIAFSYFAIRAPHAHHSHSPKMENLKRGFQQIEDRYRTQGDSRRFADIRQQAEGEIREFGNLAGEETKLIADLTVKLRERQLHRFLENYSVENAKIKGLGTSRKATLRSYGIDTAADVSPSRIEAISGFGPASSALLMSWRASLEKKFSFDPRQPVNPADINRIKRQIDQRRSQLEQTLRSRLTELRTALADIQQIRQSAIAQATAIWQDIKQVEADELATRPSANMFQRRWLFGVLSVLTFIVSVSINAKRSSLPVAPAPTPAVNLPGRVFPPVDGPTTWPPQIPASPPAVSASPFPAVPPIKGPALATVPRIENEAGKPQQQGQASGSGPASAAGETSPTFPNKTSPGMETLPPADRSDAAVIRNRLGELGYLSVSGQVTPGQLKRAIRDFRIVNGLPAADELDSAALQTLHANSARPAGQSFIGGWSIEETCTGGIEMNVSTLQAKTAAGTCRFNRFTPDNGGWKAQAQCQVGAESWSATISLRVSGNRLEWNSERGHQTYYRCR